MEGDRFYQNMKEQGYLGAIGFLKNYEDQIKEVRRRSRSRLSMGTRIIEMLEINGVFQRA